MHRVVITGVTGFLGAHIAEVLLKNKVHVTGVKRADSDIWRCKEFENDIDWVTLDDNNVWKMALKQACPQTIIHCAWNGVEANDRDNWSEQMKNIALLTDLIEVAGAVNLEKFIFLGSQAEYGHVDGKITEHEVSAALNAYASVKLVCLKMLETFCEMQAINWVWLRLFSVFGEKENTNWLIPSVIRKMQTDNEMDFTNGDQKYAYLYVKDFAAIINKIASNPINSGIYNISADKVYTLKSIIQQVRDKVNPEFKLNFGALPYRPNQSMHIEGDISKITNQIGELELTDFDKALENTIAYYSSKSTHESV